ncbi:diguanylate cyclase [Marinobacter mobilis]|uniref:diguanylate cyclase n=1 Tax=Marinobacter mobilis TaxID=488533 RepID=A0A1H2Y281_9GAMM|nr:diguanylate cyclase [Marinobacter mobilis]SDW99151.1 diguanylate cyclase (GGDEF) domain-containing protein [Marinobacter mobilis]
MTDVSSLILPAVIGLAVLLLILVIHREWRVRRLRMDNLVLLQELGESQRRVKESSRELRELFDHSAISVMLLDRYDHSVRYANDLALEMFGVDSANALTVEVMQQPDAWPVSPYSLVDFESWLGKAGRLGMQRFEWKLVNRSGYPVWLDATLASIPYEGRQILMFTGVNISARKIAESTDWLRNRAMLAMNGDRPLSAALDLIVAMFQFTSPYARCAIMTLDEHTQTLQWGSRPGFGESFLKAMDNLPVRYGAATCGSAASIQGRVVTADIDKDDRWDRYRKAAEQAGVASCWSEPVLASDGHVLGTFAVYHDRPWEPAEQDIESLTGPLYLASLAIERYQARDRLQRMIAAEKTIREISVQLQTMDASSTDSGVSSVLNFLCEYLQVDRSLVLQGSQDGTLFEAVYSWPLLEPDEDGEGLALTREELDSPLSAIRAKGFCVIHFQQSDADDEVLELLMPEHDTGSCLMVPIVQGDRISGLLAFCTGDDKHRWQEFDINTVTPVAALLGSALSRKNLMDELTFQALHDRLTGLYNRGKTEDRLRQEIARSSRYGNTFSLILFDVDHFKLVNDRFGHNAGDDVLVEVAAQLSNNIRVADFIGRWGGEEFLVILPETSLESGGEVAENLRMHVAQRTFPIPDGGVTVSAGVSAYLPGDSIQDLVKRADAALYLAKEDGRNQVKVSA